MLAMPPILIKQPHQTYFRCVDASLSSAPITSRWSYHGSAAWLAGLVCAIFSIRQVIGVSVEGCQTESIVVLFIVNVSGELHHDIHPSGGNMDSSGSDSWSSIRESAPILEVAARIHNTTAIFDTAYLPAGTRRSVWRCLVWTIS